MLMRLHRVNSTCIFKLINSLIGKATILTPSWLMVSVWGKKFSVASIVQTIQQYLYTFSISVYCIIRFYYSNNKLYNLADNNYLPVTVKHTLSVSQVFSSYKLIVFNMEALLIPERINNQTKTISKIFHQTKP